VFYLSYLRSELTRRKGRTILTVLGLSVGVALVIAISALSRGLDHAQKTALNPLSSIGTDLTVTLSPTQPDANAAGGFGGGGGGFGGGAFGGANREVIQANQSALTDLSKLGKAGTHFVKDFFLPGTQLTFPQAQAKQVAALPGVAAVASGLVLSGVHQEGTVPKQIAKFKTGGQRLTVTGRVQFQQTAAERAKTRACFEKLAQSQSSSSANSAGGNGAAAAPGAAQGGGQLGGANAGAGAGAGGGGFGGGGGGRGFFFSDAAAQKCLPPEFRNFRRNIVTPTQVIQQIVNPPQTNIKSSSYTIAGVNPAKPDIGLVTPSLLSSGTFLAASGGNQALLADSYASQQKLKVGSALDLNGTTFKVVGLVKPPLGGQTADVYVPLAKLQSLATEKGLANVLLVRADSGNDVGTVQREIASKYPNAQVASAKSVTDQISGSLVDASNLSRRLGLALAIIAAIAAFLMAALLTLSSVGKRVRELGTLKALGWTQWQVVRQVIGESAAQGVMGGLIGVLLGLGLAAAIGQFGPTLKATSSVGSSAAADAFGFGSLAARSVTDQIPLSAPVAGTIVIIGFGLAVLGGLIAGALGALRAARLRPADALRTVE
jgi:ABC-type antimicrobial peptide transport system permease subunit